jgi:hypothetical protein
VQALAARALEESWSNETQFDTLQGRRVRDVAAETIARTETAAADLAGKLIG